jgi:hypothetical protein
MSPEISTAQPRVSLPAAEYVTIPEVRQALDTFLRVYADRADARRAVDRARRAVLDAETGDARALADAMLDGSREPQPRAATVQAQTALADAKARFTALSRAVELAHTRLRDAVIEHAPAWAAQVDAEHRDALYRYASASVELDRARRDLVATGGVLAMLVENPGGLVVRPYRPGARLGIASSAVADALADVRERGPVLPVAETESETETVAV